MYDWHNIYCYWRGRPSYVYVSKGNSLTLNWPCKSTITVSKVFEYRSCSWGYRTVPWLYRVMQAFGNMRSAPPSPSIAAQGHWRRKETASSGVDESKNDKVQANAWDWDCRFVSISRRSPFVSILADCLFRITSCTESKNILISSYLVLYPQWQIKH